jgi:hypothetical protein
MTGLNKLTRRLKLIDFFNDDSDDEGPDPNDFNRKFIEPSKWVPKNKELLPSTLDLIEKLERITLTTLQDYTLKDDGYYYIKSNTHNLTHTQKQAIKNLRNNKKIILKRADKGGMTVIMDKEAYTKEALRQLNDTKYYKQIPKPLQQELIPKINDILKTLYHKGFISEAQRSFLQADKTNPLRRFYLLPKIHKPKDKWPQKTMPQGRPIVSDCGTESRRVSELIDYYLAPLAHNHPSYIKDTYDFIQKIRNQTIDPTHLLVTGDVTSLYTNMDIDRTLQTVRDAFQRHPNRKRPDDEILQLLELTMKNNDFLFAGLVFLQIFGTAMGKNFAPNCANLYLEDFDDKAMHNFNIKPLFFYRFLDDTFFLWPGTEIELKEYETFLNNLIPDITITLEHSPTHVNFLDTTVFKHTINNTTTLQTKVYFKDTDTHQLLHTSSFHPPHTFRGVLTSQVLRFKRLCSYKQHFDIACTTLFRALRTRGYSRRMLRKTKHNIWNNYKQPKRNNSHKIIPIILPYGSIATRLTRLWKQHISNNPTFNDHRLIAAYYKHKTLSNRLTSSKS